MDGIHRHGVTRHWSGFTSERRLCGRLAISVATRWTLTTTTHQQPQPQPQRRRDCRSNSSTWFLSHADHESKCGTRIAIGPDSIHLTERLGCMSTVRGSTVSTTDPVGRCSGTILVRTGWRGTTQIHTAFHGPGTNPTL